MPAQLGHAITRQGPRVHALVSRTCKSRLHAASRLDGELPSAPIKSKPAKIVFSGIQPTGVPHLGNYLGALRTWTSYENKSKDAVQPYETFWSIVDLHALTGHQDVQFLQQRIQSFASLLAIGLNKPTSIVFMQSEVSAHTRLMWILSTIASTGYLSRMTQWKSKLGLSEDASMDDQKAKEKLRLGLFSYPVLQAADILLYNPDVVPVGEDQAQHIEFARILAKSFNAHYGANARNPCFRIPELDVSPAKRIMSLRDPTKKMSKSDTNAGSRILITDTGEEIHRKLRAALTDSVLGISYDRQIRPAVSNLVDILTYTLPGYQSDADRPTPEAVAQDNANLSMKAFKQLVADNIIKELDGVRDRFHEYLQPSNPNLKHAMVDGASKARKRANETMKKVDRLLGLTSLADLDDKSPITSAAEAEAMDRINQHTIKTLQRNVNVNE